MGHHLLYTDSRKTKQEAVFMKVTVKQVGGHVEIYDLSGEFLFSADTMQEAAADLREFL